MIYTSYFANIKNLPNNFIPIAICGKAPDNWDGLCYKRLAPKWEFFKVWKDNHDNNYYISNFYSQVLSKLNPQSVVRELFNMCPKGTFPVLICYEKPDDFCHRHLVADWLNNNGFQTEEFREDR